MAAKNYRGFKDLIVYQKSYELALEIFKISKTFPKDEKYSLIDQIRRSSRSVPANIAEAWYKRKYVKAFTSKLTDCLSEAAETEVWLDFSLDLNYINRDQFKNLINKNEEILKMLTSMIQTPEKFCN